MPAADPTAARPGPAEPGPPVRLTPELEAHVAACPICRDGSLSACPLGLALSHALIAGAASGDE